MIAKFHSAPGHSMETTLTISLPPVQSVRASRAEREREREREREWEEEQAKILAKEQEKQEKKEKKEKKKEEQERKKQEQERRKEAQELRKEQARQKAAEREREKELKEKEEQQLLRDQERERAKGPYDRSVSYKDKFQKMRERYDKVTAVHETAQRDLEFLNSKMKKLQAENDLLLDALYHGEPALYERYFPRSRSPSPLPEHHSVSGQRHFSQITQPPTSSSMPPPNMVPPPSSSAALPSSGWSMAPPISPINSINMPPPPPSSGSSAGAITPVTGSMLPPSSAGSTNGFAGTNPPSSAASGAGVFSAEGARIRRSSTSSSRSRRRSDLVGVPLAPDDAEHFESGDITPTTRTPTRTVDMSYEDGPFRSPRVNGNVTPRIITNDLNGFSSRRPPEVHGSSPSSAYERQSVHEDVQEPSMEHDPEIENVHSPALPGPDDGNGVMHSPIEGEDADSEVKRAEPETSNDADVMDIDETKPTDGVQLDTQVQGDI